MQIGLVQTQGYLSLKDLLLHKRVRLSANGHLGVLDFSLVNQDIQIQEDVDSSVILILLDIPVMDMMFMTQPKIVMKNCLVKETLDIEVAKQ